MAGEATELDRLLAEESARSLLQTLGDLGGEAAPSELDAPAGLAPSTRSKWLARLRDARLISGPKARVQLTPEGWAAAGRLPALPGVQLELAEAIKRWPTEAHRAFVRLAIAAVVSRHHLGEAIPQGHPGFITTGRTGTGKTALARFVCDVFGLDQAAVLVGLPDRTGGEILGRRVQTEDGYRFERSPLLEQELVVFDEFDKAERELQRDALLCFQGDYTIVKERTRLTLHAVPMLTCNKHRGRLPVPDEYRRRAVVLDTDPLLELLADLDLELRKLTLAGGPPRLDLAQLTPPALRLDEDTFLVLRELLQRFLTPDGWTLASPQSLELLVLGYAPLMGDAALEASAAAVAMDYLSCADTVGEVQAGWQGPFLAAANEIAGDGGGDIAAALERASREQLQIEAARDERRSLRVREQDTLTAARAELVAALKLAEQDLDARKLPRAHKVAGAGLRATLRKLREEAGHARAAETLDDVAQRAQLKLQETRALVDAIAAERRAAEQAKLDTERERKRAAAAAREEKARARRELTQLRSQAKELERLYRRRRTEPDERPLAVLQQLGLVAYAEIPREPNERKGIVGALSSLFDVGPSGWWYAPRSQGVRFIGDRAGAQKLAQWGEATQQLIAVALAPLHARERELEQHLGVAPRKAREQLQEARIGATVYDLNARRAG